MNDLFHATLAACICHSSSPISYVFLPAIFLFLLCPSNSAPVTASQGLTWTAPFTSPTFMNITASGVRHANYNNVRFAQPPVVDLRYRKPKIPPSSPGVVFRMWFCFPR